MKTPQPFKTPEAVSPVEARKTPQGYKTPQPTEPLRARQASALSINVTPGSIADTVEEYFVSFASTGGHLPTTPTVTWTIDGVPQATFTIGDAPELRTGTIGVGADIVANMDAGDGLIAGPVVNLHVDLPG